MTTGAHGRRGKMLVYLLTGTSIRIQRKQEPHENFKQRDFIQGDIYESDRKVENFNKSPQRQLRDGIWQGALPLGWRFKYRNQVLEPRVWVTQQQGHAQNNSIWIPRGATSKEFINDRGSGRKALVSPFPPPLISCWSLLLAGSCRNKAAMGEWETETQLQGWTL